MIYSKIKCASRIQSGTHEYCKGLINDLHNIYGCIQMVEQSNNEFALVTQVPLQPIIKHYEIIINYMYNVYACVMILYGSIHLVYVFILTHSLHCDYCTYSGHLCACYFTTVFLIYLLIKPAWPYIFHLNYCPS